MGHKTARQPNSCRFEGAVEGCRVVRCIRGIRPAVDSRFAESRRGFTLLELMIVMSVLIVAFLAMSQALVTSMKLTSVNRESALATDGIRERMEVLEGVEEFSELFALYNANSNDDPGLD